MSLVQGSVTRRVTAFFGDDEGAVTVEGVLWLPVYAFFLTLIVDASLMFNGQAQAQRAIQDLNRLASSGFYVTEEEVEERGEAVLSHLSANAEVDATIDTTNGLISTVATIPAADIMAVGLISKFTSIRVTVSAQHVIES
ncbi:TadE/TadG family type IV pilus assembly protein [Silicimonas sp. MF1-12-2]|uniref:TadE/TadG family type IV pilus assembly protein n=1 Tax=Silicimonas sp. MF1-12-2 TaxID=3384793 RepID=UPI0039B511DB